jgi:hypothetical protein
LTRNQTFDILFGIKSNFLSLKRPNECRSKVEKMKKIGKESVSKRLVIYEVSAFLIVIAIIWLDEILDIPYPFYA